MKQTTDKYRGLRWQRGWVGWLGVLLGCEVLAIGATGPGSLDTDFHGGWVLGEGEGVRRVIRDAEGRWLVARGHRVLRLLPDGRLDPEFDGGAGGDREVLSLALAGEGKIYVGGSFSEFNGWRSPGLVRLNANGARDTNYAAANLQDPLLRQRNVRGLTVQPDGGVIVTGDFQDWNGVRAPSITRLNAEGQMDVEFTENLRPIFGGTTIGTITSTNVGGVWVSVTNVTVSYETLSRWGTMTDTAVLSDGRVIVSGVVSAVLEADGRPIEELPNDALSVWTMLPNDEVLKASGDRSVMTVRRYKVTADEGWEKMWEVVHPCNDWVTAVAMQPDGAILVGGVFTVLGGERHQGLARLKPDGSVDAGFVARLTREESGRWEHPQRSDWLAAAEGMVVEPDGGIVVYGTFTRVDDQQVSHLARLHGGNRVLGLPELVWGATHIAAVEGHRTRAGFSVASATPIQAGWYRDGQRLAGENAPVLEFGIIRLGRAGTYQLRVTNELGVAESPLVGVSVALNSVPGSVDGTFFQAPVEVNGTAVGTAWGAGLSTAPGGYHLFGQFESVDGHVTRHVARVRSDGQVDPGFVMLRGDPREPAMEEVRKWVALSDGRYVAEVTFGSSAQPPSTLRRELIAVREDGSVDSGFVAAVRPRLSFSSYTFLAATSGGGLLVAGSLVKAPDFTERVNLVQLRGDGSLDPLFQHQMHPTRSVNRVVVQPDGRILAWQVGSSQDPGREVQRLKADGTVDDSFRWSADHAEGWSGVHHLFLDHEGRILIAPQYYSGGSGRALLRFLPDGSLDPAFNMALGDPWPSTLQVNAWGLQSDGRLVLAVGSYRSVTAPFPNLIRVQSDGTLDPTFTPVRTASSIRYLVLGPADQIVGASTFDSSLMAFHAHDERVLESPRWSEGRFEATIRTRPGRRYYMEATGDPAASTWVEVGSVDGDGMAKPFSVNSVDHRFYRMRITDR